MSIQKLTEDMLDEMVSREIGIENIGKEGEKGRESLKDMLKTRKERETTPTVETR